ncbi:MAG: peptidase S41 [Candidatus Parcubacteria bacterium]|nr:MAG: peptidase S41 [Candidatus Parcubacteria bacterium]
MKDRIIKVIKNYKFYLLIFILTLNIALAFNITNSRKNYSFNFFSLPQFKEEYNNLLIEVWQKINEHYIEQGKINPDKAAFEAVRGIIKSLDDPYSEIFTPSQAKIFEENLQGSFCGIGAEIGIKNNTLTIISPLPNTPAEKAGLKAGDFILKIDNENTANMTLDEAVSKIRGECNKKVILTIFRESWNNERDIEIIRDEIKIQVIESKFLEPNIGYIKINTFNQKTVDEFKNAWRNLKAQKADRFIIDLRNNPGGYLDTAIEISELFIPQGRIILKELWGKEKIKKEITSKGQGVLSKEKIVVLINKGSASASEIFAGALRDNLGIKLIGEKTFGKGSVQQVFYLRGGYTLKLTIAYWLTPSGLKIEGNGLKPDIEIEDKKDEINDLILEKAKEIISKY